MSEDGPLDPSRSLTPVAIRLNESRVRRGFLPKIARVASRIPFAGDAVAVYFCARDPATPMRAKGLMLAALAYFVLPADAIPDVLAGVGFTDDAAVLAALIALMGRHVKPAHREAGKALLRKFSAD